MVSMLRFCMISAPEDGQMREMREPTLNVKQVEKGFRLDRVREYIEKALSEIISNPL